MQLQERHRIHIREAPRVHPCQRRHHEPIRRQREQMIQQLAHGIRLDQAHIPRLAFYQLVVPHRHVTERVAGANAVHSEVDLTVEIRGDGRFEHAPTIRGGSDSRAENVIGAKGLSEYLATGSLRS